MSDLTFVFQGKVYKAVEGELIFAEKDSAFGDWIKMTSTEYEFHATRIAVEEDKLVYRIDKVTYFVDDKLDSIYVEDIRPLCTNTDLSKLKKGELLKISEELGLNVSSKTTKKELIDLIEGIGDVKC